MTNEESLALAREKAVEASKGNKHSSKENRIWGSIIKKLAVQEDYKKLHVIANALFEKAADGDMNAIKEIGDRLDGKSIQENKLSGDSESPVVYQIVTGVDRSGN